MMNIRWALSALVIGGACASHALDFASQLPVVPGEGGPYSSPLNNQLIADNFTSAATGTAQHVTFWGSFFFHGTPYADGTVLPFDVFLYDNAAGNVGSQLQSDSIAATLKSEGFFTTFGGDTVYKFDASLAGLNLTGGAQYFLSIQSPQVKDWRWHNGIGPGDYAARNLGGGWLPLNDPARSDNAFVLSTVPEPASMAVLGLGLAGLIARRRRK